MLKVDVHQAIRDLDKIHRSLGDTERKRALAKSLNRAMTSTRAQSAKITRKEYRIRSKDVKRTIGITKASPYQPTANFLSKGAALPIYGMGARKTKKGVTVNIKGKRKTFPGAFIAAMRNGHVGVFARAKYEGNKLVTRRKRINPYPQSDLPIVEIKTLAVPSALSSEVTLPVLVGHMRERFIANYAHELAFRTARAADIAARNND